MLRKCILILLSICTVFQARSCFAQSSQQLNNQGCDSMVKHDYSAAERLFLAAYTEAQKTNDFKRMHAALNNLEELYTNQGLEQKAAHIKALNSRVGLQKSESTVAPRITGDSAYEAALARSREQQRQRQAQQERQAKNFELDQQIQQIDQQRRADEQRAASMQSDAYSTEHESIGRLRSSSAQSDFVRARIGAQH